MKNNILLLAAVLLGAFLFDGCRSTVTQPVQPPPDDMMSHPWANCGVGSFIHYKLMGPDGRITDEKQMVIEADSQKVMIEAFVFTDKGWASKGRAIIYLEKIDKPSMPSGMMGETKEEPLTIAGKQIRCRSISYTNYMGRITRLWMSSQVPGGVVRHTNDDLVVLELIDFAKK